MTEAPLQLICLAPWRAASTSAPLCGAFVLLPKPPRICTFIENYLSRALLLISPCIMDSTVHSNICGLPSAPQIRRNVLGINLFSNAPIRSWCLRPRSAQHSVRKKLPAPHKADKSSFIVDRFSMQNISPKRSRRRKNWTKRPSFPGFQLTLDADHEMTMHRIGKRKYTDIEYHSNDPRKRHKLQFRPQDRLASNTRPPGVTHLVCGPAQPRSALSRLLTRWKIVELHCVRSVRME